MHKNSLHLLVHCVVFAEVPVDVGSPSLWNATFRGISSIRCEALKRLVAYTPPNRVGVARSQFTNQAAMVVTSVHKEVYLLTRKIRFGRLDPNGFTLC